jgi:hypothetical protein
MKLRKGFNWHPRKEEGVLNVSGQIEAILKIVDTGIFEIGSRLSGVPGPQTPLCSSLSAFSDHPGETLDF